VLRYDFDDSVGYWVCMTSQAMRRELTARLAEQGITLRQWEVLAWLACDANVSQAELAECMGIEPPTLAGVLRRMERDGWLRRRCCDDDRRRNRLEATEKAEEIWQRGIRACNEVRSRATKGISPGELAALKKTCARIRENLAEAATPCARVAPPAPLSEGRTPEVQDAAPQVVAAPA
jgi:MarR family transcriptional regulator for hemolysin